MNVVEACALLGTQSGSGTTDSEIKQSHRIAAGRWHPDRGGDTQAMQRLNAARDYLLSMNHPTRTREWVKNLRRMADIRLMVDAEMGEWETRLAARVPVTNTEMPNPEPSVTNKRRAADWEGRHADKVREQTNARVKKHRAGHTEQYKEYMREYMKMRRQSKGEGQ